MADPRLTEFNNLKINFTSILDAGIYKNINFRMKKNPFSITIHEAHGNGMLDFINTDIKIIQQQKI